MASKLVTVPTNEHLLMEGLKKRVQEDSASAEKEAEAAVHSVEARVEEKVEDAEKVALWDVYGPHPSLALLTFWQGVVELCIGIAVIVSDSTDEFIATY